MVPDPQHQDRTQDGNNNTGRMKGGAFPWAENQVCDHSADNGTDDGLTSFGIDSNTSVAADVVGWCMADNKPSAVLQLCSPARIIRCGSLSPVLGKLLLCDANRLRLRDLRLAWSDTTRQ